MKPKWTDRETERLLKLRSFNMDYHQIGAAMDKTPESVRKKLRVEERREPAPMKNARKCLSCPRTFDSAGAHNRICSFCKDTETWKAGIDGLPVRLDV